MGNEEQVTIVGAGIVGICCALSLQERDIPVRLVDRGMPGQQTSFGNAGVISPWSIVPQALPGIWKKNPGWLLNPDGPLSVRPNYWPRMIPWGLRFLRHSHASAVGPVSDAMEVLCANSIDLFRRHLSGTGHEGLVVDSCYVHAFRHAGMAKLDAIDYRIRKEKGGTLELIGSDELRRLEPALSKEFQAAVLIKGQARALSPGKIGTILADKARAGGAEFEQIELTSLFKDSNGEWVLKSADKNLVAKKVVLAAGIWSAQLLEQLGLKVPLVAERGYHVGFPEPGVELNNSVMDVDNKVVASSMLEGLRLAGTSEFAHIDAPADKRQQKKLIRQAQKLCPDLNTDQSTFWMGHRPSLPNSLPVLGPITGQEGLFGAFGHSHYGLMMAPKSGELIADLLSGRRTNIDLAPYASNRF
ncbi:MAG: FAD-dependent oxidoreductase [Hyphomicrobiales bacterium]|nr:FAD-dependent oxidoreductase [Hyphomicrobiales bacterium]MCP4997922.1 FAD-dependent oxidoreductase [Hyphomicrobiales bacterium]